MASTTMSDVFSTAVRFLMVRERETEAFASKRASQSPTCVHQSKTQLKRSATQPYEGIRSAGRRGDRRLGDAIGTLTRCWIVVWALPQCSTQFQTPQYFPQIFRREWSVHGLCNHQKSNRRRKYIGHGGASPSQSLLPLEEIAGFMCTYILAQLFSIQIPRQYRL